MFPPTTVSGSGAAATLSGGQTSSGGGAAARSTSGAARSSSGGGGGPSGGSSVGGARSAGPAATLGNWPSMVQSSSTRSGTDVQPDIYEYSSTQGGTPTADPPLHAGLPRGAFAGSDSDSRSPGFPGHGPPRGARATPGQLVGNSSSSVGGLVRSAAAWCAFSHFSSLSRCLPSSAHFTAGLHILATRLLFALPHPNQTVLTTQ